MPAGEGLRRAYPPHYWDKQAPHWDDIVGRQNNPHQFYYREADLLISSIMEEHMQVLELGSGTGGSTSVHADEVAQLVATDISRSMLRGAERRLKHQRSVSLATADAGALPFIGDSFDAVFSRGVLLSYVTDVRKVVAEAYRILRSRGWIALDVMNRVREWEPSTSWAFSMLEDDPVYIEQTLRGGRQIREIYRLSKDSPYARKAEREETVNRKPKNLSRYVEGYDLHEARLFEAQELRALLEELGFQDVTISPLGHLANSLAFDDQVLKDFVRDYTETLVRLFFELSDHLKLETAWHLFASAKKGSCRRAGFEASKRGKGAVPGPSSRTDRT